MTATYSYDVFGELRPASSPANEWLFTGEQRDRQGSRNFYYLRVRYYDPAVGRFLSQDPLPGGNLCAYAGSNPTNFTDPSGLYPPTPCIPLPFISCRDNPVEKITETVCSKEGCFNALRAALGDATDAVLKALESDCFKGSVAATGLFLVTVSAAYGAAPVATLAVETGGAYGWLSWE
jgi:RHS repeat-associated protein